MKRPLLVFVLWASALAGFTQRSSSAISNKLFYAEAGGPGQIFSANFDGRFKKGARLGFGYRLGVGFTITDEETIRIVNPGPGGGPGYQTYEYRTRSIGTIPVGINYLFGKPDNPNIFEVGAGATFLTRKSGILRYESSGEPGSVLGHATFMYRRQPLNGGFSWRIGFTPVIGVSGDIFPLGAVGLGYSF